MKKTILGVMLAAGALLAAPAQALDSDLRIKGYMVSVDGDDSAATNLGVVYGLDFLGMIGAEFEASTTISDGEYAGEDYSVTQVGGFATLMTPGPIYFKAKAGLLYNDFEIGGFSDTNTDPAYGLGLGLFGLEIEYTRSKLGEEDLDMLTVAFGF
ncbi:MAG TPA: hypothetical protein VKZ99_10550 [Gammaproteobacteria bacterium]|nr:hypothetical protein [Gammaproteobacteria bacterium]